MNTTTKEKTRAEVWRSIEAQFFGRCYCQSWDESGRVLTERLDFPGAKCMVIVEKTYAKRVKGTSTWPDLQAVEVYCPVNAGGTWDELTAALAKMEKPDIEVG